MLTRTFQLENPHFNSRTMVRTCKLLNVQVSRNYTKYFISFFTIYNQICYNIQKDNFINEKIQILTKEIIDVTTFNKYKKRIHDFYQITS